MSKKKKEIILTVIILTILLILTTICYLKYKPNEEEEDYTIVDTTEICAEALEEIYKDDSYTYYLPCMKSDNIFLKWKSGVMTKMMDELKSGNVTIKSLINHGLKVYKYE